MGYCFSSFGSSLCEERGLSVVRNQILVAMGDEIVLIWVFFREFGCSVVGSLEVALLAFQ